MLQVVLMLLLAVRLRWILCDISHSFVLRLAITVFTIVLVYTVAQVNVVSVLFFIKLQIKVFQNYTIFNLLSLEITNCSLKISFTIFSLLPDKLQIRVGKVFYYLALYLVGRLNCICQSIIF